MTDSNSGTPVPQDRFDPTSGSAATDAAPRPADALPGPIDRPILEPHAATDGQQPATMRVTNTGRRRAVFAAAAAFAVLALSAVGAYAFGNGGGHLANFVAGGADLPGALSAPGDDSAGTDRRALAKDACTIFLNKLAADLGVTTGQLQTSAKSAALATIDQEVADGKIPQSTGDALKQRVNGDENVLCKGSPLRGGGKGGHRGMGGHGGQPGMGGRMGGPLGGAMGGPDLDADGPGLFGAIAKALNVTAEALHSEIRSLPAGSDICTLAANHSLDCAAVKADVRATVKSTLDAAVSADRLAQAREDKVLARLDAWLSADGKLPAAGPGRPFGGMGGPMHGREHHGTDPDDTSGTDAGHDTGDQG